MCVYGYAPFVGEELKSDLDGRGVSGNGGFMFAAPLCMWKLNSSGSEIWRSSWTGEKVDRGSWGYAGYSSAPVPLFSQGSVLYGRSLGDMIEDLPKYI